MRDGIAGTVGSRRTVVAGLVGGLVHAGLAAFLWNRFGMDSLVELVAVKPLNGLYVLLGMVLLGAVPAACYAGRRVVSPAAVVGAAFGLSALASAGAGPVRAPSGAPSPFGLYVLAWIGVLAIAVVIGRIERARGRGAG